MPMYFTALAEALQAEGHYEDALGAARQAIMSCSETGQTIYEPQARHTLGVIEQSLSTGSRAAEAVDSFTEALKSAQAMGAPLLATAARNFARRIVSGSQMSAERLTCVSLRPCPQARELVIGSTPRAVTVRH